MLEATAVGCKDRRFAATPWTKNSEEWQALDRRLAADHLVRRIDDAVEMLNLDPLLAGYLGVGKPALPPDRLLRLVLYEVQSHRPSPAQWARDVRESEPVRWLLLGLQPSRAQLYAFRDRIAPFLSEWISQTLRRAIDEQLTPATRAALDGSSVAAHAARRCLLNEEHLRKRREIVEERLQQLGAGKPAAKGPGWLARTAVGLRWQRRRYQQAAEILRARQAANAQRRSTKRKPAEKVLVSGTDPEAVLTRDKWNVFRPLYVPQLLRDLDSPLIFAYDVLTQNNDNGVVEPMVEQMADRLGRKPEELFVDSGYVSLRHLEFCEQAQITVYGPQQEHDFSAALGKKKQTNRWTELPKSAFRWLPEEQTYQCPEGHRLKFQKKTVQRRIDHTVPVTLYVCPAEHCLSCPRQAGCTKTPQKGRTVSRMEREELLDALRERMSTDEAKRLYKRRSQTVELNYADFKEHRGLRRFHGRSLSRARAEVGTLVLARNLLTVATHRQATRDGPSEAKSAQTTVAA